MEVRTFRAGTLQEALQLVRHSLGPDAAVLTTRNLRVNRLGLFPKNMIEVDASVDSPTTTRLDLPKTAVVQEDDQSDYQGDYQGENGHQEFAAAETWADDRDASDTVAPSVEKTSHRNGAELPEAAVVSEVPRRKPRIAAAHAPAPEAAPVRQPLVRQHPSASNGLPSSAVISVLTELLEAGVEPNYAKALMSLNTDNMPTDFVTDAWKIRQQLTRVVMGRLECAGGIKVTPGNRTVVAVVGPTGSGKTSTLAKIAAGVRFEMGCQIGLITVDTFRLGAVDQLLQYAELMSAQLEVVSSADQVGGALERLSDCDLVMLDTAGRSHRDADQLTMLKEMVQAANPDSVQLVVSATCARAQVCDTIAKFSDVGPTELLITKLDEAVAFGEWMSMLCESSLPVSYLTTGQHVPQDIIVANPRRLASVLLGNDATDIASPSLVSS